MTMSVHSRRLIASFLLAALTLGLSAPVVEAKQRYKNRGRSKHTRVVYRESRPVVYRTHTTRVVHRSNHDALAGFIGGLVVGAVLGSASQSYGDVRRYDYYDPYCEERFDSLQLYRNHCESHRHERVVRVINVRSGDCVETMRYSDGNWRHCDDRDYGHSGGYRDRDRDDDDDYRDRDYDRDWDDD